MLLYSIHTSEIIVTTPSISQWLAALGVQPPCCHFDIGHRAVSTKKFPSLVSPPPSPVNIILLLLVCSVSDAPGAGMSLVFCHWWSTPYLHCTVWSGGLHFCA